MNETPKPKTGGRQAGTPNKLTTQTRQLLHVALAGEIEALPDTLNKLEPSQRIDALSKLIKYVLPAMENINSKDADKLGVREDADILEELDLDNARAKKDRKFLIF